MFLGLKNVFYSFEESVLSCLSRVNTIFRLIPNWYKYPLNYNCFLFVLIWYVLLWCIFSVNNTFLVPSTYMYLYIRIILDLQLFNFLTKGGKKFDLSFNYNVYRHVFQMFNRTISIHYKCLIPGTQLGRIQVCLSWL